MKKYCGKLAAFGSAALMAGCNHMNGAATDKLVQISNDYVAAHYPGFDTQKFPPVVKDVGDHWEVSYKLPPTTIGGTPMIYIDKVTLRIVKVRVTQ